MARMKLTCMAALLALSLAGCGGANSDAGTSAPAAASAASPEIVSVEASDFEWKLSKTEFKAGQPITFQLKGSDGAHGFSIVGTDVSQPIKQGETAEVAWTPEKAGEYTVKCNRMCGAGHSTMETVITVK